jgi:hypothetical protein
VYQSIVQLPGAVALKVTVPLPQRELVLASVGGVGNAFLDMTGDPFIATSQ